MGKAYGGKSQEVECPTQIQCKDPHQIKNRLEKEVQKHNKSIIWFFTQHYFCSSFSLVL